MRLLQAFVLSMATSLAAFLESGRARAEVAREVLGSWSGDPNCSRVAMRHVFSEKTFEWIGDGRRYYLGEATFEVKGGRLTVTLTRDIDRPFQAPDAPKAGDVLTYQPDLPADRRRLAPIFARARRSGGNDTTRYANLSPLRFVIPT